MNFKIAAIAIISIVYLYNLVLSIIKARSADNPIPANVADIYDKETYAQWRSYHSEKSRLSIFSSTVSFVIDLILLSFNLYASFASLFDKSPFMQMFAVLLLTTLAGLLNIPFTYYNTMVIEQKYGFNRTK